MKVIFLYQNALMPESGGTERATSLVINELNRQGHKAFGLLHCKRNAPDRFYINNQPIDSLRDYLINNRIDVVVNQIAYHHWLLEDFLKYGGEEWRSKGGKIISFMHLDPTPAPKKKLSAYLEGWKTKTFCGKLKRILFFAYLPFFNYKQNKIYRFGLRYLYEKSDRYILMSESFTKVFGQLSAVQDLSKIRIIPNMLTFPTIESTEIITIKDKIVIVVARMDDEQKNISWIINVWKSMNQHSGYSLHIIGDGKDLHKLKKIANGDDSIIFEGQQSPHEWYRRAKIFLMASPREGWGLTITESLQCGVVPIVLNTSTVFADIITNGENGFLATTKQEFTERITELLHNESTYVTMATNALKSAARFTPEKIGEQWTNVLSEFGIL